MAASAKPYYVPAGIHTAARQQKKFRATGEIMQYHLYVSGAADGKLARFRMDSSSGRLTAQTSIETPQSIAAMAVDGAGRFLFATMGSDRVGSFLVDRHTGDLEPINAVAIERGPCYLNTDPTDRFLFYSCFSLGTIGVLGIEADGSIQDQPVELRTMAQHAHSIQADPGSRFVYVPHINPPNRIDQFRFDATTGSLTPSDPPSYSPSTPQGPRHICFHPTLDVLYSVNENGGTVSAHRMDAQTGILDGFQTLTTLPEGYDGSQNNCAEIKITPTGSYLYASNRGHDSIAGYRVDAGTGELTPLGHTATEKTPRMFNLDPTGQYLYAAGQDTGGLASYRIDAATGALEPLEVHQVGGGPAWLEFVACDE
jgi:6-phosphogluconolactonase